VLVSLSLLLSQDNMTTAKSISRTPSAKRRRISEHSSTGSKGKLKKSRQ